MDSEGMRYERCRLKEILEFEAMKKHHRVGGELQETRLAVCESLGKHKQGGLGMHSFSSSLRF